MHSFNTQKIFDSRRSTVRWLHQRKCPRSNPEPCTTSKNVLRIKSKITIMLQTTHTTPAPRIPAVSSALVGDLQDASHQRATHRTISQMSPFWQTRFPARQWKLGIIYDHPHRWCFSSLPRHANLLWRTYTVWGQERNEPYTVQQFNRGSVSRCRDRTIETL